MFDLWVAKDYSYCKIRRLVDLDQPDPEARGFGIMAWFQRLLAQLMKDRSDQELERYLQKITWASSYAS